MMRAIARTVGVCLTGLICSCLTPNAAPPPQAIALASYAYTLANRGTPLTPGTLVGKVAALEANQQWRGRSGVAVELEELKLTGATDAAGCYGFKDVPSGTYHLRVSSDGFLPVRLACTINPASGLSRINLPLIPATGYPSQAATSLLVGGVATDPRGAALTNATMRLVDSQSSNGAGSNLTVTSNAEGFFEGTLAALNPARTDWGNLLITAAGRTPGGLRCESDQILNITLSRTPALSLIAATTAIETIQRTNITRSGPNRLEITASPVPSRRDEVILTLDGNGQKFWRIPESVQNGKLTFTLPDNPQSQTNFELLPLGIRQATPNTFTLNAPKP
jgi:hypothetical protein